MDIICFFMYVNNIYHLFEHIFLTIKVKVNLFLCSLQITPTTFPTHRRFGSRKTTGILFGGKRACPLKHSLIKTSSTLSADLSDRSNFLGFHTSKKESSQESTIKGSMLSVKVSGNISEQLDSEQ